MAFCQLKNGSVFSSKQILGPLNYYKQQMSELLNCLLIIHVHTVAVCIPSNDYF